MSRDRQPKMKSAAERSHALKKQVSDIIDALSKIGAGLISQNAELLKAENTTKQRLYLSEIQDQIRTMPERMNQILGQHLADKIKAI